MTDTATPARASSEQLLGGRYRLLDVVGEGGMALVYRAEDVTLERTVAVKVLRAAGPAARERARSETRILATLSYHSLVTLFDTHVSVTGLNYLVLEYMRGRTLADRIAAAALEPHDAAALAVDLGEALHVVHSAGIVHRDVKPSNVLLCPSPVPGRAFSAKIADFGVACVLGAPLPEPPATAIGTAAYLAPELVRGAAPAPPVDVYGLGLTLLEAVTGHRAFAPAEGVEAVVMRLSMRPAIPAGLPPGWSDLLTAMTERDPADRPTALEVSQTARELHGAPIALTTPR